MSDAIPLLKFTPSAAEPDLLEAITVQREALIAALVDSALDERGGLRHHLLVGPRGIGKTHILSLVASRVRGAGEDATAPIVAWLEEDPWTIRTYDKFLAAIAGRVAAETRDSDLTRDAQELRSGVAGPSGLRGEQLLRDAVGGRRLVLLVENLDEVFRRIGPDGQARFRAFAEDWGQLLILATTPQLFPGIRSHAAPFYGFFAVTHLDELTLASAAELLKHVARLRGDSDLLQFLATDTAAQRLTAVEALAGGHPRIWLLLAGCVSIAAIDQLVPLFLEAIDDLTPYYQDRLRELNDQQQELVMLLSEAGGALSNRALSERSGIAQNQIATLLRQLTDRGYVRRAELPDELASGDRRMSFWELREPLMRLCLDVKQARGEPLRIVVEFLRVWYGPRLLDELDRLPPSARLAMAYASEAFRTLEAPLEVADLVQGSPSEVISRAERGLVLQPENESLQLAKATGLLMEDRLEEARDFVEQLVRVHPPDAVGLGLRLQLATVQQELGESIDLSPLIADLLALRDTEPSSPLVANLIGLAYDQTGRLDEALSAYTRAAELDPTDAATFGRQGVALGKLGRLEEALATLSRAVELKPTDPTIIGNRGVALSRLGHTEEALEAFTRAVERDPSNAFSFDNLGLTLGRLGREEEALEAFTRAVELRPSSPSLHAHRGLALHRLGHPEDALAAYSRAIELEPTNAHHHHERGIALGQLGRDAEAVAAYARAIELDPQMAASYGNQADLLRRLGKLDEAERAATRAVALDDGHVIYRFTLTEVVLSRGEIERALLLVREALAVWSRARAMAPGDVPLICQIVWERFHRDARRRELIAGLVDAYRELGGIDEFGRGVVSSISWFLDESVSQRDADEWVEDWSLAPFGEADIPLHMLEAARAWKRDRDQAHLLTLPPEQRSILLNLVTPEAHSD